MIPHTATGVIIPQTEGFFGNGLPTGFNPTQPLQVMNGPLGEVIPAVQSVKPNKNKSGGKKTKGKKGNDHIHFNPLSD